MHMSNETLTGKILYNKRMSEEWLEVMEDAPAFDRFDLKAISALVMAPCELGTVIVRDEERSFYEGNPLTTLRVFYRTHRLFDYSLTRRCFSLIDGFSSYKAPFVNWHYVLCPLEQPENGTWVNPLAVYDVQTIRGICFAELTNGLILELPIQRRSFLEQSEKALYTLGYLRREYTLTLHYEGLPLDYLSLPNTPFLNALKERPILQRWSTKRGVFQHRYLSEVLKHKEDPFTLE